MRSTMGGELVAQRWDSEPLVRAVSMQDVEISGMLLGRKVDLSSDWRLADKQTTCLTHSAARGKYCTGRMQPGVVRRESR